MTTREPVPRGQLAESHSGVPPDATTTDMNLLPRLTRHRRLPVETASTTKVGTLPAVNRYRDVRRVSTTPPWAQPDAWPGTPLPSDAPADGRGLAGDWDLRSVVSPDRPVWCPFEPVPRRGVWPPLDWDGLLAGRPRCPRPEPCLLAGPCLAEPCLAEPCPAAVARAAAALDAFGGRTAAWPLPSAPLIPQVTSVSTAMPPATTDIWRRM